jgi:hypothetical protein
MMLTARSNRSPVVGIPATNVNDGGGKIQLRLMVDFLGAT